jgi:hypothetical protein
MNSNTFQRVMDGHADTPQERVLAEMMNRNPALFFRMWEDAMQGEEQVDTFTDYPMFATKQVAEAVEASANGVKSHPIHMSNKRRREFDDKAPEGYLVCSKCGAYKKTDEFSTERTPALEYRGFRRAQCKKCCAEK